MLFKHAEYSTVDALTLFVHDNFICISAEEVLEQADYLYSCGETEKLYQLLLQYKNRYHLSTMSTKH